MADNKAISLVIIMLIIAIVSLVLRFALEQFIKFSINQNETEAAANLKLISAALENYAQDHQGSFPGNLSLLAKVNPSYLNQDYALHPSLKDYVYSCARLEPSSYSCSAVPLRCRLSGEKIYSITTGGVLASEDCSKKE